FLNILGYQTQTCSVVSGNGFVIAITYWLQFHQVLQTIWQLRNMSLGSPVGISHKSISNHFIPVLVNYTISYIEVTVGKCYNIATKAQFIYAQTGYCQIKKSQC